MPCLPRQAGRVHGIVDCRQPLCFGFAGDDAPGRAGTAYLQFLQQRNPPVHRPVFQGTTTARVKGHRTGPGRMFFRRKKGRIVKSRHLQAQLGQHPGQLFCGGAWTRTAGISLTKNWDPGMADLFLKSPIRVRHPGNHRIKSPQPSLPIQGDFRPRHREESGLRASEVPPCRDKPKLPGQPAISRTCQQFQLMPGVTDCAQRWQCQNEIPESPAPHSEDTAWSLDIPLTHRSRPAKMIPSP